MTHEYKFPSAVVTAHDETKSVTVKFNDGAILYIFTNDEWQRLAIETGYGTRDKPADVFRCMFENTCWHIIVSEIFGLEYPPILWTRASGQKPMLTERVMAAVSETVLALQRFVNGAGRAVDKYTVAPIADACNTTFGGLRREFQHRLSVASKCR
jgi:hypothetical protein